MKLETFFDNFEVLAEAPNGVKVLRELILQLAVRGKLVAQDEKDEPASVLLEKIKAEKEQQLKEKKIKKIKTLLPIEANDAPYEKPESWVWCRLGEIIHISSGDFLPSDKMSKGGQIPVFGGNGITGYHDKYNVNKPTLVIGRVGFYCGSLHITPELAWITDNAFSTYFSESHINFKFLYWLLKGSNISIRDNATAQPVISGTKIYPIIIGLPPINEQKHIVSKVDQLMSLCDELEARQQKKRETRAHINSAALDRLLAARAQGEFAEGWRRISDNFDLLYDAPENVGALRQAILQLAVMGKLVEQDENDEPASVLLEKIKAKKDRLIKEKKIKKSDISSVEPNELSNTLPRGWILSNINEISLLVTDGEHQTPPRISNSEIPLGTAKNVRDGYLDLENTDYVSMETAIKCWKRCEPMHEDILMVCVGATTGRLCLLKKPPKFVIVRSVALVRPFPDYIYPEYLATVMKSPIVQSQVWKNVKQSAQPCLYINRINVINIPIPPLAEQHRIVARVDQLMSLCDKLEAGLLRSQADSEKLIEAVVGRMLAGGDNA